MNCRASSRGQRRPPRRWSTLGPNWTKRRCASREVSPSMPLLRWRSRSLTASVGSGVGVLATAARSSARACTSPSPRSRRKPTLLGLPAMPIDVSAHRRRWRSAQACTATPPGQPSRQPRSYGRQTPTQAPTIRSRPFPPTSTETRADRSLAPGLARVGVEGVTGDLHLACSQACLTAVTSRSTIAGSSRCRRATLA